MFVMQSTYDALDAKYLSAQVELEKLRAEWNALVTLINNKGGAEFLRRATINKLTTTTKMQFSKAEIQTLIKLCHPDKHKGAKDAEEITKKLLELRK